MFAGLLFVVDVMAPLGVASGVAHLATVLAAASLPKKLRVVDFAMVATLLIVARYWLSPSPGDIEIWKVLAKSLPGRGASFKFALPAADKSI